MHFHRQRSKLSSETVNETERSQEFYSVEFTVNGKKPIYQFKLWENFNSPFFLVKNDSVLIDRLKVGYKVPMTFYRYDRHTPMTQHDAEITAIQRYDTGRFKGHYLIGLNILETNQ